MDANGHIDLREGVDALPHGWIAAEVDRDTEHPAEAGLPGCLHQSSEIPAVALELDSIEVAMRIHEHD
jgi:hypothetical protein